MPEEFRQNVATKVNEEKSRLHGLPFSIDLEVHRAAFPVQLERLQLDARQHFRATPARRFFQLPRDRAHPAHRHFPFARLVADKVIKETPILQQRRIVRMREDADLGVGENETTDQIVLQITFDRATQRLLRETAPGFAAAFRPDRSGERNSSFATSGSSIVSQTCSAKTRDKRRSAASDRTPIRCRSTRSIDSRLTSSETIAQEQAVVATVLHVGRERPVARRRSSSFSPRSRIIFSGNRLTRYE